MHIRVNVGECSSITAYSTTVSADVTTEGIPAGSNVSYKWVKIDGPGTVTFNDNAAKQTLVTFSQNGKYILRFSATCNDLSISDDIAIHCNSSIIANGGFENGSGSLPDSWYQFYTRENKYSWETGTGVNNSRCIALSNISNNQNASLAQDVTCNNFSWAMIILEFPVSESRIITPAWPYPPGCLYETSFA